MPEPLDIDRIETPIGLLLAVTDRDGRLRAVDWTDHEDRMHRLLRRYLPGGYTMRDAGRRTACGAALAGYFAGDIGAIDRLPAETGGSPFQRSVWRTLREIPCGETISYTELARRIDRPTAIRAVGLANGANPISIVVPCHRVIGANGALTGYGGGVERKRWLIAHERTSSA